MMHILPLIFVAIVCALGVPGCMVVAATLGISEPIEFSVFRRVYRFNSLFVAPSSSVSAANATTYSFSPTLVAATFALTLTVAGMMAAQIDSNTASSPTTFSR